MDFLILFLLYVILVLLSILFCVFSGRKHSFPSRVVAWGTQVLLCLVPARVLKPLHQLFHTRSCLFVVLNFVLEVLVYGEYSWEVFSYCRELEFHILILLLPYLLLLVNLGFFLLCSKTNPGTITKSNQALFLHVYAYDGVMFKKDTECPTCSVRKPARSKHCGVCNGCVHRFDHHCIWVNNCIGAFNMRYFLLYLLSLLAMAIAIAIITTTFLIQVVVLSNMMLGHYLDDRGQEHPVDVVFLIQHLFLTFPRIVFMLGFVVIIALILGSYFCFTLYLILTNQTSNEWFKAARCKCTCAQHCSRHSGYKNVYSRGALSNIMEIVRPLASTGKKRR
ncbi:palmitoyltransferase ZDHHC4 isoform X2 [Tiliqua scincoides]